MIFFDGTPGDKFFKPYFTQFIAHYYNSAIDWGKEVGVDCKIGYPSDVTIYDVERGKLKGIRRHPWQSDSSVGKQSWSYVDGEEYKTADQLVKDMVDIVSKNGSFLLNIGPKADGTIPDEIKQRLLNIGQWLQVNGDAIYGTRCWARYGEGATLTTTGSHSDKNAINYNAQDIRFTTKGSTLYATCLAWTDSSIIITSLNKEHVKNLKIEDVSMLGSEEKIRWKQTDKGLRIFFPKVKPCNYAYSFKIMLQGQVVSNVETYYIERDPLKPKTADTYIYNHSKTPASIKVTMQANGKTFDSKQLSVEPEASVRIESNIEGIENATGEVSPFSISME
jgi:alpha-L-fucosidase